MTDIEARILKEFYEQMIVSGYDKVTLAGISRALGISTGHLSYYFPKKEDLLLGCYKWSNKIYSYVIGQQLSFIKPDSFHANLLLDYCMFMISFSDSRLENLALSFQERPLTVISTSLVLVDSYKKSLEEIGVFVSENELKLAHSGMYFLAFNYNKMRALGQLEISLEEIFKISLAYFLEHCGFSQEMINDYSAQIVQIAAMLDKHKAMETTKYYTENQIIS